MNTNLLAAAFNLNSNPVDLSGIYTVKIVISFSLGQNLFREMEISALEPFCFSFQGKDVCIFISVSHCWHSGYGNEKYHISLLS